VRVSGSAGFPRGLCSVNTEGQAVEGQLAVGLRVVDRPELGGRLQALVSACPMVQGPRNLPPRRYCSTPHHRRVPVYRPFDIHCLKCAPG